MQLPEAAAPGSQRGIIDHLKGYARVYAFSQGFRFGSGAEYDIAAMAQRAAEEMLDPPAHYRQAGLSRLTSIAEKQIGILVDHMIIARAVVYAGEEESDVIGEATLGWARNILCPMWPICQ